jgi:hypothetical protein
MAALTYEVYNDPTNNDPVQVIAYNTVTVQKYLQVAIDPVINYSVAYPQYSWFTTTT